MPKSLQGPGELGTSLGLLGRDLTQGFRLINQEPKSDLKPPREVFNSCQEGEFQFYK